MEKGKKGKKPKVKKDDKDEVEKKKEALRDARKQDKLVRTHSITYITI